MTSAFLPLFCPLHTATRLKGTEVPGLANWRLVCCEHSDELLANWPEPNRPDSFWLQKEVLAFLQDNPQGIETRAVLLENVVTNQRLLLTAQTFLFNAAGQVSDGVKGETSRFDFRRMLLSPISFKVLCLGQFLTSGDFGQDGLCRLPPAEAAALLPAVAEALLQRLGGSAYLIKDLYPTQHPVTRQLQADGHYLLPVDPSMTLQIQPAWENMEDYLADLSSKYRVRYRRARGKLAGVTRHQLSAEEVISYRERCFELYQQVSKGADFNATSLQPEYFPWLARLRSPRKQLEIVSGVSCDVIGYDEPTGDEASPRFHGYFNEEGSLIGFTSAIPNGPVYHAHFLGLEEIYKHSHHLYHNMLFDLLEDAICGGYTRLDYGRTALEIKSSVGALPADFAVLVKARNRWLNRVIPFFTSAVYTQAAWTERNPFRG